MSEPKEYSNLSYMMRRLEEENEWLREEREALENELEEELEEAKIAADGLKREKEYFELKCSKLDTKIMEYEEIREKTGITKVEHEEDIDTGIENTVGQTISDASSKVTFNASVQTPIMHEDSHDNGDIQENVAISSPTASHQYIIHITDHDVLCGGRSRRDRSNVHAGNIYYLSLVKEYELEYLQAKRKNKYNVVGKIIDRIKSKGGRFLVKGGPTGTWMNIGDFRTREKISRALREGTPTLRKILAAAPIDTYNLFAETPIMEEESRHRIFTS